MTTRRISHSTVVNARPEAVFELLADPARHPELDGSGTVQAPVQAPRRLQLGSRFGMRMRRGLPYRVTNVVVEFERSRRIAWRHWHRHVWRWELEPAGGGATRVTETFDWGESLFPWALEMLGMPARNSTAIQATLHRLESRFRKAA